MLIENVRGMLLKTDLNYPFFRKIEEKKFKFYLLVKHKSKHIKIKQMSSIQFIYTTTKQL